MSKFRKKPVVIDAHRLGDGWGDGPFWDAVIRNEITLHMNDHEPHAVIKTLEGDMRAEVGDWIIKGVNGEFYPCKPDIFEKTYEAVE